MTGVIPCHRGGHHCKWPACPEDCDGRPGTMTEHEPYQELKEARESFENIRSILIHTLQGPGRAAFWAAVNAKNRINVVLAEPNHESEDEEIAWHTGRVAYRNGRSRTENPYASTKLRDAWFEGYDG